MGPYTETRRSARYIFVAVDIFSKWVEAAPTITSESVDAIHFLEDVFGRWGFPRQIITDQGNQFRGRRWDNFCQEHHIECFTTAAHHQRANPVERRNQEIKKAFRALALQRERQWDQELPTVLFNLRTRLNAANGCTPSHAILGYELPRPGDWRTPRGEHRHQQENRDERLQQIAQNQEIYRRRYTTNPPQQPDVVFERGDLVMARDKRPHRGAPF